MGIALKYTLVYTFRMAKHVRIDDENYEALQKLSEETELSIARLVNKAIREWLDKRQVKDE